MEAWLTTTEYVNFELLQFRLRTFKNNNGKILNVFHAIYAHPVRRIDLSKRSSCFMKTYIKLYPLMDIIMLVI